jgi:PAT family beta-lactamase induction signal transducer AmpG
MYVAVVMYKKLGLNNTDIAFYTSWLYLPWVIKPLWAPLVELFKSNKWWTVTLQSLIGISFAGIAFSLPTPFWLQTSMAFLWLTAFSSATHDIAADGFYLAALRSQEQAFFVGIRSLAYRASMLFTQGAVVWTGGWLELKTGSIATAWLYVLCMLSLMMFTASCYHFWKMPAIESNVSKRTLSEIGLDFFRTFYSFFHKKNVWIAVGFLLLYRLGEAQLVKMGAPFLLDSAEEGGLGLSTRQVGIVYGTTGPIGLILGGVLGGIVISRKGLRFWLWTMAAAINLPQLVYIFMAWLQITNLPLISSAIFLETFGYGFGFTAYMVFMMYLADGPFKTAHYALCTGFMALGMMIPGLFSGWLQAHMGYTVFFIWVLLSGIPGVLLIPWLNIPETFGRK